MVPWATSSLFRFPDAHRKETTIGGCDAAPDGICVVRNTKSSMLEITLIFNSVFQLALGLLFFASGVSKFLRLRSIQITVENYRLLPASAVPLFARMLAPAELAAGLLLLFSIWLPVYQLAWVLTVGLLLMFSFAIASVLARGLEIPCGCGLLLNGHVITRATLGRNLVLLALLALNAQLQPVLPF